VEVVGFTLLMSLKLGVDEETYYTMKSKFLVQYYSMVFVSLNNEIQSNRQNPFMEGKRLSTKNPNKMEKTKKNAKFECSMYQFINHEYMVENNCIYIWIVIKCINYKYIVKNNCIYIWIIIQYTNP
jgi:hypothetical protein